MRILFLFGGRENNEQRKQASQQNHSTAYFSIIYQPARRELDINRMVRPAGIEPATYGFEARRSIQLSYGRTAVVQSLLRQKCQG